MKIICSAHNFTEFYVQNIAYDNRKPMQKTVEMYFVL